MAAAYGNAGEYCDDMGCRHEGIVGTVVVYMAYPCVRCTMGPQAGYETHDDRSSREEPYG